MFQEGIFTFCILKRYRGSSPLLPSATFPCSIISSSNHVIKPIDVFSNQGTNVMSYAKESYPGSPQLAPSTTSPPQMCWRCHWPPCAPPTFWAGSRPFLEASEAAPLPQPCTSLQWCPDVKPTVTCTLIPPRPVTSGPLGDFLMMMLRGWPASPFHFTSLT